MVRSYPLYEELLQKCIDSGETEIDQNRLCATINKLGQTMDAKAVAEHYHEICALMIHHHAITTGNFTPSKLPYEAKIMPGGKGITFNSSNIPVILQRIIMAYIDMH